MSSSEAGHITAGDTSRRSTVVDDRWEVIGGKYFYDGDHVLLDDRPADLVGPLEEPFRYESGIHDVTVCATVISVYASGWEQSTIRELLVETVSESVRITHLNSVDNTRCKNFPRKANTVFQFKIGAR